MKMRRLGTQKSLWGLVVAAGSIASASAHFVYDSVGAAHNLEHLTPSLTLGVLVLVLGATTLYCFRRK